MIKNITVEYKYNNILDIYNDLSYEDGIIIFIKSGFPNKIMYITESPHYGVEIELIDYYEYIELKSKIDKMCKETLDNDKKSN